MTYIFKIYFDILDEIEESNGIIVEPIEFTRFAVNTETELDDKKIESIISKVKFFFKTRLSLKNIDVKLDTIIK